MGSPIHIELISELTTADITILRRYLSQSNQFSDSEWHQLRSAIDKMASCSISFGDRHYSFQRFYATFINGTYARPFLAQLQRSGDLQKEGGTLQAQNARKILAWLQSNGISP